MTKQEYLKRLAALTAKYEKLDKQRQELVEAYKRDCQPCHKGDIVKITLDNATSTEYIGVVCDEDFLYSNGEFRPSLVRFRDDKITNKRIYYDGRTPIKNIEVLGKSPTCSECLWRKIREGKMYCSITIDYDRALEVSAERPMCSRGNYVKWEGSDIPWKQKISNKTKQ